MPTRTQQTDILSCAYASHGDTKHVLLFPEDPAESFEFGALPSISPTGCRRRFSCMLDLDIGMNHRLCRPLTWDDTRKYDRGKVMTAADARSRRGLRPLSRRRWRRHPLSHLSRHAPDQRLVFHPRYLARPLCPLHRRRRGLRRQHAAAVTQVRDRKGSRAAAVAGQCLEADQIRRHLFRLDLAGHGRGNPDGLYDDDWREDRPRITKEQFLARISVESVVAHGDGLATLYLKAGSLFGGRGIDVGLRGGRSIRARAGGLSAAALSWPRSSTLRCLEGGGRRSAAVGGRAPDERGSRGAEPNGELASSPGAT